MVYLPYLRSFRISTRPAHSILLNYLHIPAGASVTLASRPSEEGPPIPDYLLRSLDNLSNISHITSVNLNFDSQMGVRFKGPSGGLYVINTWDGKRLPILDHRILQSLNKFPISTTERLAFTRYHITAHSKTEKSGVYRTLLLMHNLRTLTLTNCLNLSFILALNPSRNASNTVVCPKLKEVVLYIQKQHIHEQQDGSSMDELLEMAKDRASRGAKLLSIVITCPWGIPVEVSGLRSYVSRVEYRLDDESPRWDVHPGEVDEGGYGRAW
jgi:hypothetical protein